MLRKQIWIFGLIILLMSCARPWTEKSEITPGSVWTYGLVPSQVVNTPTVSFILPTVRPSGEPVWIPTPDNPHYEADPLHSQETYIVQSGDMLSAIAELYNLSVEAIVQANNIPDPDALEVGQQLIIPLAAPRDPGPGLKLIPDSNLVYGPLSASLDLASFIDSQGGYLAGYTQEVNGEILDSAHIVQRIAQDYSVSPRMLLALLEYRSGWVTNPNPDPTLGETPLGYIDGWYVGLYRQLAWAAVQLNTGFYRWRASNLTHWVLMDGSVVPIDPTINAGTAGVQYLFARLEGYSNWLNSVSPGGFYDTYFLLFGHPFETPIEPLTPADLAQPILILPFNPGESWAFTGGPHLAWDAGTPYAALDFAPPGEALGCVDTNAWVTAVADGVVTRTGEGVVILDLDGDGNEGTGWVILYMHIESRDRVQPGKLIRAGESLGHPSCEGGISTGTHVHLARKFNGVWIPADAAVPFVLSGWVASGTGEEYVGKLTRNGFVVESFEGNNPINQIQR
jgi:LasA protease